MEEDDEDEKNPIEQELRFRDDDYQILRQLDDEFRDHFKESQSYQIQDNSEDDFKHNYLENILRSDDTLYEYLMRQTKEILSQEEDLKMAEAIIGNLDDNGLLLIPLEEIAILNSFEVDNLSSILFKIQELDPPGIAATSIQQSLLLQLKRKQKQDTLAYKIIQNHFQDLLHNRLPVMRRSLHCSFQDINTAIFTEIAKLDLHPGSSFIKQITQPIVPDISINPNDNGILQVNILDEYLPTIRLNQNYLKMIDDVNTPAETKDFIKQKLMSAKWLLKNIYQRNDTLEKIGLFLAKEQEAFFTDLKGHLVPLTMKTLAEAIEVHESTVARAVSSKYLTCSRGIFPLKYFFTNEIETDEGNKISSKTVKDLVLKAIQGEDKKIPLSDQEISNMIKQQGIHCARRTVAKYRGLLNIGNAHQRKKFR
jgi:RNA polymerase sigma-54 factor